RDRSERVPRLRQAMAGALGGDGAAVELAGEPDCEVADVDHLLHLAEPFLRDLADLEGDERAERLLLAAKLLPEKPYKLAATRRGDGLPVRERPCGTPDRRVRRLGRVPRDPADLLAGDRRCQ